MSTSFTATTPLEAALQYAGEGIPIIPLHHVSFSQAATKNSDGEAVSMKIACCSCKNGEECDSKGKHPRYHPDNLAHGLNSATTDPDTIKKWFNQWQYAGVAILAGRKSGFIVIDVDPRHGGDESLIELQKQHGEFSDTLTETTGSGGKHILFEYPELSEAQEKEIRNSASAVAPGIDVKVEGGYIVCSPTMHASGSKYKWDNPGAAIAKLPGWFLDLMLQAKTKVNTKKLPALIANAGTGYSEGARNDLLMREISAWQARGVPDNSIDELAQTLNQTACNPPLNATEVSKIVTSVITRYDKGNCSKPLTDLGNAERFRNNHQNNIAFCAAHGGWQIWNGKHWRTDEGSEIRKYAHHTARYILREAAETQDKSQREDIIKWARASESISRTKAMIEQAEAYLTIPQTRFDGDAFLLNTLNGIVDLKTGELIPHDREKYCRKICPVNFEPDAPKPVKWLEFLNMIFDNDTDLIKFVQQSLGYSLSGDVSAQCLFFLHGTGANGKSTFIETVADLMGEYHYKTAAELLMSSKNSPQSGAASPDIASLQSCRMVTASELDSGRRFSESKIKDLTGGDTIKARRLFCPEFNFKPTHKLWIFGNNKPTIRDTDTGIWRRIRLIPFNVTIPEADRQEHYRERFLIPEMPGILRWAVQGCIDWQKAGSLISPETVKAATTEFRDEMDLLAAFLMECCKRAEYYSVKAGNLYDAYKKWAETSGENVLSGTAFGREMGKRGFAKKHTMSGSFYYGITTMDSSEIAAPGHSQNSDYTDKLAEL